MKKTKSEVQKEAEDAIEANGGSGSVFMATGTGKSKIPIDIAKKDLQTIPISNYRILLCVPTEKLRDKNWKEEFEKWEADEVWERCVERTCYVSMHKLKDKHYDLVILDEGHNITENNSVFFDNCTYDRVVLLTATMPRKIQKLEIIEKLGLNVVYTVTLDQAVEWGLVSPFSITVVYTSLEKVRKTVVAGTKSKPFLQTEFAAYKYLTDRINALKDEPVLTVQETSMLQMLIRKRMHLIYNLQSKTDAAKILLGKIPITERTLIFAGSIKQAEELCIHSFHSKSPKGSTTYNDFCEKKIDRLASVDSLNEGHNIPDLDRAVLVQITSNSLDIIQRIGRIVRFREGHLAKILIIVAKGTVDETWLSKAIADIDINRIKFMDFEQLKLMLK